jgi:hypothetical protein
MTNNDKNALSHGAFSTALILPGEDFEEFKALHASVIEEFRLEGQMEEDAGSDLAKIMWRKLRVSRYFANKAARAAEKQKVLDMDRDGNIENIRQFLRDGRAGKLPLEITREYLLNHFGPTYGFEILSRYPQQVASSNEKYKNLLRSVLTLDLKRFCDPHRQPEFEEDYSSGTFVESEIKVEERLNAQLEKAIKRLAQIRALKSLNYGSHRTIIINDKPERIPDEPTQPQAPEAMPTPPKEQLADVESPPITSEASEQEQTPDLQSPPTGPEVSEQKAQLPNEQPKTTEDSEQK